MNDNGKHVVFKERSRPQIVNKQCYRQYDKYRKYFSQSVFSMSLLYNSQSLITH
jgi:hypothetical protein